jgi:hypothetical protein
MKKMKRFNSTLFVSIVLVFTALSNSYSQETQENSVPIPDGKAVIYIVRPSMLAALVGFKVTIDTTYIGINNGDDFIYAFVDPGKHKVTSKAETEKTLEIECEQGKSYYIEQLAQMGLVTARVKMLLRDEKEGKEKLNKCKLSKKFTPKQ